MLQDPEPFRSPNIEQDPRFQGWPDHHPRMHSFLGVPIVSKGTTPEQQVLKGTLETMPGLVARTQIQTPTLIIVGEVVNFADQPD